MDNMYKIYFKEVNGCKYLFKMRCHKVKKRKNGKRGKKACSPIKHVTGKSSIEIVEMNQLSESSTQPPNVSPMNLLI